MTSPKPDRAAGGLVALAAGVVEGAGVRHPFDHEAAGDLRHVHGHAFTPAHAKGALVAGGIAATEPWPLPLTVELAIPVSIDRHCVWLLALVGLSLLLGGCGGSHCVPRRARCRRARSASKERKLGNIRRMLARILWCDLSAPPQVESSTLRIRQIRSREAPKSRIAAHQRPQAQPT